MKKIITLFLLFSTFFSYSQTETIKKITIEDIYKNYIFYPKSVYGIRSMNDGVHYSALENRGKQIVKYSYKTGEEEDTLFNINDLENEKIGRIQAYEFNDDESKILLITNKESIYRRSFKADYFIFNLFNKKLIPLSNAGRQQLATFSPDGKKIAFVRENNLFVFDIDSKKEKQITTDGKYNYIINGAPDWVYEEEFEFNKAFVWAPDSKGIAFMRFDESQVKEFGMLMYGGSSPEFEENKLYPKYHSFKYPKAGENNSLVTVHYYDLEKKKTKKMNVGTQKDQYIPRIKWTKDEKELCIYRLNRLQNKLEFLFANRKNGKSKVVYTDENKYYVDEKYFDFISFLDNKEECILMSERSGYNHIYLLNFKKNKLKQITKGKWDVTDYLGYDKKNKTIYYQSAEESPMHRAIFAIKTNGKDKKKLSEKRGTNRATFSNSFQYYINYFSDMNTPTYVSLHNANSNLIRVLEDNKEYREMIAEYEFNNKEIFSFTTTEGVKLNGWMLKPPNFDKNKKYPLYMTQYSGPNSQEVTDSWSFGWQEFLSQHDYVVCCVDPRGTGGRGEEFKKQTYLQLGKYETIDQIEAAKYLGSLEFIDETRIGIFGWSFGGYISTSCLVKGEGIFKMGIAVAPVTNWRYYDNIYTERFMRTPQENPEGYDQNSPTTFADDLQGKYLIVHGIADDNVHVQNSYEFIESLVQANKQFDMQFYTNRNHGIYGGNTRLHLFNKIFDFIKKNL